jgi:hypothetical protein
VTADLKLVIPPETLRAIGDHQSTEGSAASRGPGTDAGASRLGASRVNIRGETLSAGTPMRAQATSLVGPSRTIDALNAERAR